MDAFEMSWFLSHGETKETVEQIRRAARRIRYRYIDKKTGENSNIGRTSAYTLLGNDDFLSGIQRCAFHGTAVRYIEGDETEYILFHVKLRPEE